MAKEIVKADLPRVTELLQQVLGVDGYQTIDRMGGLTNHTYHVVLSDGREFVVRIPGEGTEDMINRQDEMVSTKLACEVGVDAQLLYFGEDGSKVTEYIPNAVTMSAESMREERHIDQAAEIFRRIHACGQDTKVPFDVFDMAATYERIIQENRVPMFGDYEEQKAAVMAIKAEVDAAGKAPLVPCHNDPLCENWVEGNGRMYLIDWEYAGMNDGMWDLADISIEASYDEARDLRLLRAYLGREPDASERKHFEASKLYVDYLWTLWAKTRVPFDGQPMEDWACERYARLKDNIRKIRDMKED